MLRWVGIEHVVTAPTGLVGVPLRAFGIFLSLRAAHFHNSSYHLLRWPALSSYTYHLAELMVTVKWKAALDESSWPEWLNLGSLHVKNSRNGTLVGNGILVKRTLFVFLLLR